eukprot:271308_1
MYTLDLWDNKNNNTYIETNQTCTDNNKIEHRHKHVNAAIKHATEQINVNVTDLITYFIRIIYNIRLNDHHHTRSLPYFTIHLTIQTIINNRLLTAHLFDHI